MNHLSYENLSGQLGFDVQDELRNDMERTLFAQMRALFQEARSDVFVDDFTLLRFLAADNFCVEKGLARLLRTLQWRKVLGAGDLMENPPPHVACYESLRVRCFVGVDRCHRPILMERLGEFMNSHPGIGRPFTAKEWLVLYAWDLERHFVAMRTSARACGKPVRRFTYVADLTGLRWRGGVASIPLIKYLAKAVETHYPEMAGPIVLINAPAMVSVLYNRFLKRFLDPTTAAKIEILPRGAARLLELADPSEIPREFGGTSGFVLPATVRWRRQQSAGEDVPAEDLAADAPEAPGPSESAPERRWWMIRRGARAQIH